MVGLLRERVNLKARREAQKRKAMLDSRVQTASNPRIPLNPLTWELKAVK